MNDDLKHTVKVLRNGVILGGLYFFSIYATAEILTYAVCKPVLVFMGTYFFTEMVARYGLKSDIRTNKKAQTLIL